MQCVEIALEALTAGESSPLEPGQAAAEYREIDTEFIYATSREVAGILTGAEGSYGAAAVKAMTSIGLVSREMLGQEGVYSGDRARYGAARVRLPNSSSGPRRFGWGLPRWYRRGTSWKSHWRAATP